MAENKYAGTQTEKNLQEAFAGESQARNKYTYFTRQAQWSTGNNGYQVPRKAGYPTTLPQDVTQDLRRRICMLLEDWGIRVKYHHPEVGGCGQMEIEVELGEMTHMADSTMAAKYIVKNAAAREGRTATFLPKPVAGEAGSGMHVAY